MHEDESIKMRIRTQSHIFIATFRLCNSFEGKKSLKAKAPPLPIHTPPPPPKKKDETLIVVNKGRGNPRCCWREFNFTSCTPGASRCMACTAWARMVKGIQRYRRYMKYLRASLPLPWGLQRTVKKNSFFKLSLPTHPLWTQFSPLHLKMLRRSLFVQMYWSFLMQCAVLYW